MTEINRAVCIEILKEARDRIEKGWPKHSYVCFEIAVSSIDVRYTEEAQFLLNWIRKQLNGESTLASWIMEQPGLRHLPLNDQGPGMRETRLAWIDDMIRRLKL